MVTFAVAPPDPELLRLRRYSGVNVVGLSVAVVSLAYLHYVVRIGGSELEIDMVALGVTEAAFCCSWWLARRERGEHSVYLSTLASWAIGIAMTYVTPPLLPLSLLVLLAPLMVFSPLLRPQAMRGLIVATVAVSALTTLLAYLPGQEARGEYQEWLVQPLLTVFLPLMVAITAVGIWQNYRRFTDQAHELRASRSRVAGAADDARRRLERDLHDGAQQRLVAMALHLGLVGRLVERDPSAARTAVAELTDELHAAIAEVRELAHGLYPPQLAEYGLVSALSAAARRTPVPVQVDGTADEIGRLPADLEAAVYFCSLEALTNASKHSGAHRVVLRLRRTPRALTFEIVDDGAGFAPGGDGRGTGLTTMADRIHAVGGTLVWDTRPGEGTRVAGSVPVRPEQTADL